ncbi:hypothetical protein [Bathymodiolus japonicus methanotrophic gill symbiont]|uniref:hypothetical protein n=1 Tax=Bathymodiolus japonicus methanotrophic gill symbiont TaxID=113269 RepID=UPI001C8ECFDE|nr:hypothetical protein [Bathymodiolus japonicus methanotrophic gill symbiont]
MKNKVLKRLLILLCFIALPAYGQEEVIESLRSTSKAFASIARKVSPSVVFVQVESSVHNPAMQFSTPLNTP